MKYHITQLPNLILSFIITKIFFNPARLVRLPIDLRNYRFISFGKNFTTGRNNRFECYKIGNKTPKLVFDSNVQINDKCHIACVESIYIGKNVLIASNVFITDHDHGNLTKSVDFQIPWKYQKQFSKKVIIKNNVWIGENVCILKGVTIGSNTVVAAGSIVTKNIPENSVVAGNPGRVIKILNKDY